ncbi:MAG: RidA family protein [Candidatus Promineifilaceae bacterium]
MMKFVHSNDAPQAIGPYAQAVDLGNLVICSGQTPIDPATGRLIDGDIDAQTRQVFQNLGAVLAAAGLSLQHIVKTSVFLKDMDDFQAMNAAYADCLDGHTPARTTVQVAKNPLDARIEIECMAIRPK